MNTRYWKMDWLDVLVALALVTGTVGVTRICFDLERKADAAQAFAVTLDQLFHDQQLSMALEQLQQGDVPAAARRLDLLLCADVVRADSELADADTFTRAAVEDTFRRIALIRPKTAAASGGAAPARGPTERQLEAERILTLALGAAAHAAQAK
jgi:hypothetical protein